MSLRRIIFVFIALFVSGATMLVGRAWLQAERQVAAAPAPKESTAPMILVAKGNLPAGQFVRPENLRWQVWPEDNIAPTYIVDGQRRLEDFVGAVVRTGIADGEPVTEGRVVKPGDRGFLAAVLTPGYRAVSVPVTVSTGIAGFVFPGDRVDVLLTFSVRPIASSSGEANPQAVEHRAAETMLTNVRVIAVDQRADDQNKDVVVAKTATLEVTPKQAEIIAVASDFGKISLSLRSLAMDDDQADKPFTHTWDNEAAHLLPPPTNAHTTIKVSVVRAAESKQVEFPRSTDR